MKRVVLITGTRKGIGRYLAEYFLGRDYIVVGCSRKETDLENENYFHYQLDVTDEKSVIHMVREVKRKVSRIDVLLNNAGIAALNHTLTTPYSTAKKIIETNFLGTFIFLREVSKVMVRQNLGRIVNFTTVAVPLNLAGEAVYTASKSAVESLTKISAKELGEHGITVNAVGPTAVYTDLIQHVPEEKLLDLLSKQAIRRYGEFRDVSNVVEFFIKEESDFVTGQVIFLGGVAR